MNRRDFLRLSAAAAVVPVVPASLPAARKLGDRLNVLTYPLYGGTMNGLPVQETVFDLDEIQANCAARMGLVREMIYLGVLRKSA